MFCHHNFLIWQHFFAVSLFSKFRGLVVPQPYEYLKTFTAVNKINYKLEFHYCVETIIVPGKSSKWNLDKLKLWELTNEDKWLTSFYDDVTEQTSWTSYHEKQSQDKTGNILTINVPLPWIHHKSSSAELQYHLMKVPVNYKKYLNPGQVAVGVSDLHKKTQWCFQNQYFWNYGTLDWESKGKSNVWLLVQCPMGHQIFWLSDLLEKQILIF